jgi:hypothetical protein
LLLYLGNGPASNLRERLALTSSRSLGDRVVWVSAADPAEISPALAELIALNVVASAALVHADLPDERLWLAFEWPGTFVVERALMDLLGDESERWVTAPGHDAADLVLLRPRSSQEHLSREPDSLQWVGEATEYTNAITDGRAVAVAASLADVMEHMGRWFGELADEHVGGGLALLALSGATSRSDVVTLRSPAALGLRFAASELSPSSHTRAGRLEIRAFGFNHGSLGSVISHLSPGSPDVTEEELRANLHGPAAYGVLLEIAAKVDPEVEIEAGSIFEQTSVNNVQTLAAAMPQRITVQPGAFAPLALPAWCLNQSLAAPNGEPVRPTPLVLANPGRSQDEVWDERRRVLSGRMP